FLTVGWNPVKALRRRWREGTRPHRRSRGPTKGEIAEGRPRSDGPRLVAHPGGLEPPTFGFEGHCAIHCATGAQADSRPGECDTPNSPWGSSLLRALSLSASRRPPACGASHLGVSSIGRTRFRVADSGRRFSAPTALHPRGPSCRRTERPQRIVLQRGSLRGVETDMAKKISASLTTTTTASEASSAASRQSALAAELREKVDTLLSALREQLHYAQRVAALAKRRAQAVAAGRLHERDLCLDLQREVLQDYFLVERERIACL